MLGSDYVSLLGEHRVGELIRSSDLPAGTKSRLLGENAEEFLSLRRTMPSRKRADGKPAEPIP